MDTIHITIVNNEVLVEAPYNTIFIAKAKSRLAGTWKKPHWVFDVRNESAVRDLCAECYGFDGVSLDVVDVRITMPDGYESGCSPITAFGRVIAQAKDRDGGAKVGQDVVVEEGSFTSDGSRKYWKTIAEPGTAVILRDVSRQLVENHRFRKLKVEILESNNAPDIQALEQEKVRLEARLAKVNEILLAV